MQNRFLCSIAASFATLALGSSACSRVDADGGSATAAYVATNKAWPSNVVNVCWSTAGFAQEKQWVESWVTGQLGLTRVRLNGWGNCPTGNPYSFEGISVAIIDSAQGAFTKGLGADLRNIRDSMHLPFPFANWQPMCPGGTYEQCVKGVAMHEFMHALGVAHEQNRPERTPECQATDQGANGNQTVGLFDKRSIMNYCDVFAYPRGTISPGDIAGVFRLYPDYVTPLGEMATKWSQNTWLGFAAPDTPVPQLNFEGVAWTQKFQNGGIGWYPGYGAHVMSGAIYAQWLYMQDHGAQMPGYPISDEVDDPGNAGGRMSYFSNGIIHWTATSGAWFNYYD